MRRPLCRVLVDLPPSNVQERIQELSVDRHNKNISQANAPASAPIRFLRRRTWSSFRKKPSQSRATSSILINIEKAESTMGLENDFLNTKVSPEISCGLDIFFSDCDTSSFNSDHSSGSSNYFPCRSFYER